MFFTLQTHLLWTPHLYILSYIKRTCLSEFSHEKKQLNKHILSKFTFLYIYSNLYQLHNFLYTGTILTHFICQGLQIKCIYHHHNNKVMSEFVKFFSLSNPSELCSDHFHTWLCQPGGINKDPTSWLDGATPPPKYVFRNIINLTNWKI
jgi:hypothetical protein